jgi:hypothetical protein
MLALLVLSMVQGARMAPPAPPAAPSPPPRAWAMAPAVATHPMPHMPHMPRIPHVRAPRMRMSHPSGGGVPLDSARVGGLLASLAATPPVVCELAVEQLGNGWGWGGGDAAVNFGTRPGRIAAHVRRCSRQPSIPARCRSWAPPWRDRSPVSDGLRPSCWARAGCRRRRGPCAPHWSTPMAGCGRRPRWVSGSWRIQRPTIRWCGRWVIVIQRWCGWRRGRWENTRIPALSGRSPGCWTAASPGSGPRRLMASARSRTPRR